MIDVPTCPQCGSVLVCCVCPPGILFVQRALREDAERCRKCRADKSIPDDVSWEKNARDRFLSVYGATIAVQWAAHVREGRGLDDGSIKRFVSEARALAQWTEEVQHV